MKYLLFFTALITATAAEQTCQCSAPTTGPDCTANSCTIKQGQCYSIQMQLTDDTDKPIVANSKGCQEDKDPNVCKEGNVFISTDSVFYILSGVECCKDKPDCNKDLIAKLPDVSTLNKTLSSKNLVCPSCFNLGKKTCDVKEMNCREGQDKCFSINGTVTKGSTPAQDFVAKGCAAQSAVFKAGSTLTFGTASYKLESIEIVEAKSGVTQISSSLSFALLLPSVLWFLLDSSLY